MFRGRSFRDRRDAGRKLADLLSRYQGEAPVVFALPRGGVPVGYEVALALEAPLDVLVARKLGAPQQRELGIGAVAEGGASVLDRRLVEHLGVTDEYLAGVARRETARVEQAVRRFRGNRPPFDLTSRTAVLVDDGLATGLTARAALLALAERRPRRTVLAVPVCAARTAAAFRRDVDAMECLQTPRDLQAISLWYRDFAQVADSEVVALLEDARRLADG